MNIDTLTKEEDVHVVIVKAMTRTCNGRMYTENALKQVLKTAEKRIGDGVLLGELNPTINVNDPAGNVVDPKNVSHAVTGIVYDEDSMELSASIRPLETTMGQHLKSVIDLDGYGFGMRGYVQESESRVVDYMSLTSIDFVKIS